MYATYHKYKLDDHFDVVGADNTLIVISVVIRVNHSIIYNVMCGTTGVTMSFGEKYIDEKIKNGEYVLVEPEDTSQLDDDLFTL